ncbi:two-component system, sensor histidine kinase YesM [Paenibacillus algorifonticola]|uniref:Two-component system, sensor histidine kinase YesM n=1 Tax=Paenibacillus algorifonticola TaxID=684063 RepID=A0A1I2H705_9BACL|nr:sensor histidine kinase [Paenibacillus algorifonticola]SFF25964.1 two-component system, sensor histidine kinase YesM [Paenibacillus algorifonticola]
MGIRSKMLIINLLVIFPSILLLTITLYHMTKQQAVERAASSSQYKVSLIANTISTLFNDIENYSKLAIVNKTYQSVLTSRSMAEWHEIENIQLLYASLNSLVESNPYINSVIIQSVKNNKLYYSENLTDVMENIADLYPREQMIAAAGSPVWSETFESPFLVNAEKINVMAVGRRIIDINDGRTTGFIFINIDERMLSQLYGRDEAHMDSKMMITNAAGTIISANDPKLLYKSVNEEIYADEGRLIISSIAMEQNDWKIVYAVPTQTLMKDQWKITLFIIGFGVAGMLIAFTLSAVFSRWITRPIIQLSRTIKAVGEGNLNARAVVSNNDEIGRVAHKFNEMIGQIQDLLQTINEEGRQKRLLGLRLLYSQIKPHFMYNTLEMVRSMALMVKARDVSKVVKAMGDFYRTSLNNGQELILVSQERKHLESYLYIQKVRYSYIDYRIEMEEAIENCWIANMLLQPLVENAIQHGLRDKQKGALCSITGRKAEENGKQFLIFTVRDNGRGMSADQLRRIWQGKEKYREYQDLDSFGISSVQERILLLYGEEYGLSITSTLGEGVQAELRVPLAVSRGELEERGVSQL